MKKNIILTVAMLAAINMAACHKDEKKVIEFSELPQTAQTFVQTHFADKQVAIVYYDKEIAKSEYEVRFTDGANIDFKKNGDWIEVEDRDTDGVPTAIIPDAINTYVATHHTNQYVVQIGKERNGYEVELNSAIELLFNGEGAFVRYDD